MGLKFHFSYLKTYLSHFLEKFLKFEELEYPMHYVKFDLKFPVLFSNET